MHYRLIHRSDAPMVKRRRSERRREPRLMSLSARMADARDQHAVDLPGDVALEAADDLSLALALLCAPRDVLLGATISSHTSQTDHVQRSVGVPVAYIRLRRWRTTFPEEASTGDTPQRLAKEASLLNLSGLSPATISSVAAWSVPIPAKQTSCGATCLTSRSSCASSSAISAERAW